ncbi:MAG: DUF1611 domain-containing protein [Candidatus Obscuribacterales bacterium]|nr:DUF1611 domain-containing protein [Candidatus Obscuribacterales bacterium]
MYYSQTAKLAVYAEGEFGKGHAKTAEGVIRYGNNPVVAVIDSTVAGNTAGKILKTDNKAPIVASLKEALQFKPDALLLGAAWIGGQLPKQWRSDIIYALNNGLDIINGLHDFLADDEEFSALAAAKHQKLLDVRRPPDELPVASALALSTKSFIVLTVGSDCSVGKMTTSLEIVKSGQKRNIPCTFVATGQTGIMIAGKGIAIDRVIGDFMAGATEQMVLEAAKTSSLILVEGQGSLVHPGFSGVTLALLHGSCPQALILCHNPQRKNIRETTFPIPPLPALIEIYERMSAPLRPAKVVAIALNTFGMSEDEAQEAITATQNSTGLVACDPVRSGAEPLLTAILDYKEKVWS